MNTVSDAIPDRLLDLLRERCATRGHCAIDLPGLVWSMAERHPDEPRPRLHQASDAINILHWVRQIETRTDPNGMRTCCVA